MPFSRSLAEILTEAQTHAFPHGSFDKVTAAAFLDLLDALTLVDALSRLQSSHLQKILYEHPVFHQQSFPEVMTRMRQMIFEIDGIHEREIARRELQTDFAREQEIRRMLVEQLALPILKFLVTENSE